MGTGGPDLGLGPGLSGGVVVLEPERSRHASTARTRNSRCDLSHLETSLPNTMLLDMIMVMMMMQTKMNMKMMDMLNLMLTMGCYESVMIRPQGAEIVGDLISVRPLHELSARCCANSSG